MTDQQNLLGFRDFLLETDEGHLRGNRVLESELPHNYRVSDPSIGHRSTLERAIEAGLVVRHADGTVAAIGGP